MIFFQSSSSVLWYSNNFCSENKSLPKVGISTLWGITLFWNLVSFRMVMEPIIFKCPTNWKFQKYFSSNLPTQCFWNETCSLALPQLLTEISIDILTSFTSPGNDKNVDFTQQRFGLIDAKLGVTLPCRLFPEWGFMDFQIPASPGSQGCWLNRQHWKPAVWVSLSLRIPGWVSSLHGRDVDPENLSQDF